MIQALIVDDEPLHIEGLTKYIDWNDIGYERPLTAESAEAALVTLAETPVDVLITDVSMPGMTGIELLATITANYPRLSSMQTLIISGYNEFEFVQEAINLGAKGYVLKPIKIEELVAKLISFRTVIEKKRMIENETTALKERVIGSIDVLHDRFVNELLEGRIQNAEQANSWRHLLDLPPGDRENRLFLFTYDNLHGLPMQNAEQRILLSDSLVRTVRVGISGYGQIYIGRTATDEVAVLQLNASPGERAQLEKQFAFVQEVIREQHDATITIGVSREVIGIGEVPRLYKELKHMLTQLKSTGSEQIHYFDQIQATEYREFQLRDEEIPEIVRLLEAGEEERAVAQFNHAFDMLLMQNDISITYVKAFAMGLISELVRRFNRLNDNDNTHYMMVWHDLLECVRTLEVREVVLEYMTRFAQLERKEQATQQHHLIRNVEAYLEKGLQTQLTVKQLAEHFQLNASYLSVLFKKEMGRTISDFILEKRLDRAKELLKDPNIKVYEVAEQVGYQTAAYFTYIFKKANDVTPQEYRDYYYED
ncbi:response regulator [Paenibacillus sp. FSL E2-0178]|uniref:response regulator n=1 Tax=Paenibacillus sp. FSL E2-0178 TaxID=2921361 RepID=UPI00315829ED